MTGALLSAGVPFVVLYAPEAATGWHGDRSAPIGIWLEDSPSAMEGFERAWTAFKGNASPKLSREWGTNFNHWERPFFVSLPPEAEFAQAFRDARAEGHPGSSAPLADSARLAQYVQQLAAGRELQAEEERSWRVAEEARWESRVREMIREQTGREAA